MSKWADYCVSKLSLDSYGMIDTVICHEDLGDTISDGVERTRAWMVAQIQAGKSICTMKRNKHGLWNKIGNFSYNGLFSWQHVPRNITKRKLFVSYYHYDDQEYKQEFSNMFEDLIVHKSVDDGDIDSDNSDDYTRRLIQKGYLSDTTVMVVLIGPNTRHRKHIDWEIWGALDKRIGDKRAGLIALLLPTHPDYKRDQYKPSLIPARVADNLESRYALIKDWTTDRKTMQDYIEQAFSKRESHQERVDNSRRQMSENTNE